nr:ketoacyl-ACP synthase III [uncultured Bacteroides sp.]
MNAYIKAISYYVPETIVSNADIVKDFPDWSEQKISVKIGIKQRYISKELTAGDMAERAANKLFEEYNIDRSSIDTIILCTQSPDHFLPTTACILQDKLNLPTNIAAFDFNLGCSGFVYGLGIAKGLISAGISKNILFLTSETYNKYIHSKDRGNRALFSDAAAATLISTDGILNINEFVFGTDGKGAKNLIVENGCSRHPDKSGIEIDPVNEVLQSPDYLYMNGSEIFNFTLEAVPLLTEQVLKKNNLIQEDIDLFIFHQANKHMLKFIRQAISIPEEKFYMCLENFGNSVSSTIPIAIYHALNNKDIKSGNTIMIAGFGVGYSWGGAILSFI